MCYLFLGSEKYLTGAGLSWVIIVFLILLHTVKTVSVETQSFNIELHFIYILKI